MKIGFLGLGKMGSRMVLKLLKDGHEVVVWNRSEEAVNNLNRETNKIGLQSQLIMAKTIQELVGKLEKTRICWIMLPAGAATSSVFTELKQYIGSNDIIIDGGNAHFIDTQNRYEELQKVNISFLGIGVSGGVHAERNGFCLMAGGSHDAFTYVKPILTSLSKPNGSYDYFGVGGSGHFVKMVHNAIEYGMMQAIGEGFGILEKSTYGFDLHKVAVIWQNGSIISSFLVQCAIDALEKSPDLVDIKGYINATGEAEWAVAEAKKEHVPALITEKSLEFRRYSQIDPSVQNSFAAKLIAALRNEFGGHDVKKR